MAQLPLADSDDQQRLYVSPNPPDNGNGGLPINIEDRRNDTPIDTTTWPRPDGELQLPNVFDLGGGTMIALAKKDFLPVPSKNNLSSSLGSDDIDKVIRDKNLPTLNPDTSVSNTATRIVNRLLGTGGEERYQLWPERLVRDAISAPHDVMATGNQMLNSEDLIKPALDMSALAGTGGLAGVGESRLATAALKDIKTNPIPERFRASGTKDDTGPWFLEGNKPIYANATEDSVKKLYGEDAKKFKDYNTVTGTNDKGNPITVWYKPGEKNRALSEVQNFKDKQNAVTDAEKSKLHYESGVNLGYPEEASRAYAYKRFGVDPNPAGEVTLGAGPFLRPALKYEGKIYKAPMGGEHMDAIPKDLQPEFTRQAMSGEDISNFNFGFMNHKGQFLDREKALKYAIDEGLLSPHDAKYGALTSTLMEDSSKPAMSVSIAKKRGNPELNKDTEVLINPSKGDFLKFLKEIPDKQGVRTLTDKNNNLHVWNAADATHQGVIDSLKINMRHNEDWGNHLVKYGNKIIPSGNPKPMTGNPDWLNAYLKGKSENAP